MALSFQKKLTIRHLRLIDALARELSISRSAEKLHTSQSAVSRGLSELETLLGETLFERTTRRVTPTPQGHKLIWHAEQILAHLDRAESDFESLSRGISGTINLGIMGAFSPRLLVKAIELTREQAPKLVYRLRSNFADSLIPDLVSVRCDLIVTHFDIRQFSNDDLIVDVLYHEGVVVVAAADHPLTRRSRLDWKDLTQERWVLMPMETSTRRAVERNLLMHAENRGPVIIEALELHYIVSLVRDAGMLTALPIRLARWLEQEFGAVRCLPVIDELSSWAVCAARMRSREMSTAEQLFLNNLKEVCNHDLRSQEGGKRAGAVR